MVGTVPRPAIRLLAGLASWMSTLMPQLSAFIAMLWAAVGSTRAVALRASQVRKPLLWFRALCGVSFTPLERHCRRHTPYCTPITFDGSLTGGGATLQAGVADWAAASTVPVIAYWADTWTDDDLAFLQVKRNGPTGQARIEAFTFVDQREKLGQNPGNATRTASHPWRRPRCVALRMRARDPILNMVIGEMALILAPMGLETRLAHLWSERNKACDAISRASIAEPCLPEPANARRVQRSANECTLLRKPTP